MLLHYNFWDNSMDKFCLGIIGRCLACQPWIKIPDLYHRQLKIMLQEQAGITLRVSLAGRSDLEPFERMKTLYRKNSLDGVLYHMRNINGQLLFYSKQELSGKRRYSLHPDFFKRFFAKIPLYDGCQAVHEALLLRKKSDSHDLFDLPPAELSIPRNFFGIPYRQINLWAGKLCGLNNWAIRKELIFLDRLRRYCLEMNIPLFVLGPISQADMLGIKRKLCLLEQLQKVGGNYLSKHHVPYYFMQSLLDEMGFPLYKRDQIHLTREGHAFLAKQLYPIISLWIQSIFISKR